MAALFLSRSPDPSPQPRLWSEPDLHARTNSHDHRRHASAHDAVLSSIAVDEKVHAAGCEDCNSFGDMRRDVAAAGDRWNPGVQCLEYGEAPGGVEKNRPTMPARDV